MAVYFFSGIDTDTGKSYATGLAARYLMRRGVNVITQKMIQTGVPAGIAEDILMHRQLMGIAPLPEDESGATCPLVFKFAASPHLAAELENREIDLNLITAATQNLLKKFDTVLMEGAGGLHVPLKRRYLSADFLQEHRYPLVIVSSGKLGSINHTLLTMEAAAHRGIPLAGIVYNHFIPADELIRRDSITILQDYLAQAGRPGALVEIPAVEPENPPEIDFSPLFEGW